ncbi:MAG: flagellar motor switch phosphatase FliY, partial [Kurthia sp.]
LLVIKQSDAAIIADLMLGGDGLTPAEELGEIHLSAVQEAMNQMMGSAATSMSTIFNKKVDISPPSIDLMNFSSNQGTENIPDDDLLVKVSFRLKIGTLIDSNIMQLLPLNFSRKLVKSLMNPDGEDVFEEVKEVLAEEAVQPMIQEQAQQQPVQEQAQPQAPQMEQPVMQQQQPMQQQPMYTEQQPMYAQQPVQQPMYAQQPMQQPVQPQMNVQQAQFTDFEQTNLKQAEARNLNMLMDIPLQVTVELGRTKRSVKEILELAS